MKVLIADDSDAIVNRLAAMLHGIPDLEIVGRAAGVAETDRAVRALRPDVLILDLHMPGGSGIDVLDALRRDGLKPIVIVLTNYHHPQFRRKCLEKGARFFLDKSTEFEMVGEVLSMLKEFAGKEETS